MKSKFHTLNFNRFCQINNEREGWNFKPRLGGYLKQKNVPLEFVKFICEMLSLEETLENTVNITKRGCLRQLHVREFENESKYYEPSLELVLPQVTCSYCQSSSNLNICKEYNEEK